MEKLADGEKVIVLEPYMMFWLFFNVHFLSIGSKKAKCL